MDLRKIFAIGYILVIGTFFLMIWVSLAGARETELIQYPPCYFNPLCSCSKSTPDLGIVRCQNIPCPRIPDTVNISKVFMLQLENIGLRTVEPFFLQSTGLYKIIISRNPISVIPNEAFLGLDRSLWELDLSYNQLTTVPNRALRSLQKLRLLNLKGNHISTITPESWRSLNSQLITLILSENSITNLPIDLFSGLPTLETIDLRGNNLREIDPAVFRDGMGRLATLILADNQLSAIPYQALSYLKALKYLDLSYNRIMKMQPATEVGVQNVNYNFKLNLDTLRLDYNQITILESLSFQLFDNLNKTYLDGNKLQSVGENAFRNAKIKELYLRSCGLKEISPEAFGGLEDYLEILDLSGNDITSLHDSTFLRLQNFRSLSLRDNLINKINPMEMFNGFQFTLYKLDLGGNQNAPISIQNLRRLRNLRVLSLSSLTSSTLTPEDFLEFGIDLEELEINFSGLKTIKSNAFRHVHGLKKLHFSETSLSTIESDAFTDIGHSLVSLHLSRALSSSIQKLPSDSIKALINLQELDASNNKLKILPDTTFHFLRDLKRLYLQDNMIETIHKGTFQGDIHQVLNEIYLSFNNIKLIQQHTFVDLAELEQLHLDDNKIDTLERRSFMNLENLKRLNLKGNKIATISYESFQNIPELEDLDLSYNQLGNFDFQIFDQVGNLAMFHVNVSHNKLLKLIVATGSTFQPELGAGSLHSNIKTLDLSFNNITMISKQFFRPAEQSMTHLHLSHNQLMNVTQDVFGNMPHLQLLDLSHNVLYDVDFDSFRNTKRLQILYISHNRIAEIPNDLFRFMKSLRVVNFSNNRLRALPDNLFRDEGLEQLDLSHNMLSKLPLTSLSVASTMTLCELDLSWNSISSLSHGGLLTKFKKLSYLDLSYNRLAQIDAGTFKNVPRIANLNLGHNNQLTLEPNGFSFQGLEESLLDLNLDNVSLAQVPVLPTRSLIYLSLAHNMLPTVLPEMATNISGLQRLNLNNNDLTAVPIVTHSLPELRYLYMAANPITSITNTSLLGVADHLEDLDLSNIPLSTLETGAFCKMHSLRTLKLGLYNEVKNFNIPRTLQFNSGLRNLEIHSEKSLEMLDKDLVGEFPMKLRNLTLSGQIKKLGYNILQGVRSPTLHFCLRNTSISKIPSEIFKNLAWVRNISVDVRDNNALKNLQNPSTGPSHTLPRSTFLIDLKMSGSKWNCDCDLGWVEVWQRKKRQYLCGPGPSITSSYTHPDYICRHTDDDLRTSLCSNKNNQSLIEVLKTDIECGWSRGASLKTINFVMSLVVIGLYYIVA